MMPNLNNLAATLVSEKGETLAKSSKTKTGSTEKFSGIFGKSKAKNKKDLSKNNLEMAGTNNVSQFQFAKNPVTQKKNKEESLTAINFEKNVVRANATKNALPLETKKIQKITEAKKDEALNFDGKNAAKVLGNRIESTQSISFTKGDNEILSKNSANVKVVENTSLNKGEIAKIHNLKKDLATNEGLKLKEKTAENTVAFSKEISPQWNGRSLNTANSVATKSSLNAKDDLKLAVSDNKLAEPNNKFATMSSYGLKKINDQIKLEERVEGVKEIKNVQKSNLLEKVTEGNENIVLTQNAQTIKAKSIDFVEMPIKKYEQNNFDSIIQQVENGIKINYNNQLKEMKIKLQPEELGEVEVKMTLENNIMKAQFVVESQTVKEILESRFDSLRNALENKGFYGTEINVSVSTGDNRNANNAFVFNENAKKISDEKTPNYLAKVENLESNSKVRKIISDSNVDIMI